MHNKRFYLKLIYKLIFLYACILYVIYLPCPSPTPVRKSSHFRHFTLENDHQEERISCTLNKTPFNMRTIYLRPLYLLWFMRPGYRRLKFTPSNQECMRPTSLSATISRLCRPGRIGLGAENQGAPPPNFATKRTSRFGRLLPGQHKPTGGRGWDVN